MSKFVTLECDMANIAFRVDLQVRGGDVIAGLRRASGHTWEVDNQFTYKTDYVWTVDAVITQYADRVPYPAEKQCLLIAGDRENKRSLIVCADEVTLVESE
jgi:hypothetical protein